MLKVTFEFKTPEEAITAIAKVAGLGAAAPAPRLEIRKPQDIEGESRREPEQTGQKRGQRADKGKKRGPYKDREQSNAGTTATEATTGVQETPVAPGAAAPAPETAAPEPVRPNTAPSDAGRVAGAPAAAAPTEADVQKALEAVFAAKGLAAAQAVLGKFNVARGRDLAPEQRAAFIEAATLAVKS
jgi:hypothetical protein